MVRVRDGGETAAGRLPPPTADYANLCPAPSSTASATKATAVSTGRLYANFFITTSMLGPARSGGIPLSASDARH
jgi:hypothetical protein